MGEAYLHNHGGLSYSLSATFASNNNVFIVGQPANDGRATITATLGNTQVTLDPDECTFSPATISANTTAITITKKIGSATRSVSLPITAISVSSTFGDNTWDAIAAAAYAGIHADLWSPGDEKTDYISGVQHTFRILGFNHNNLSENDEMYSDPSYNKGTKKAAIAIQFKSIPGQAGLEETKIYNTWKDQKMRTEILPALYNSFPLNLKNAVRLVMNYCYDFASSSVTSTPGEIIQYVIDDRLTLIDYFVESNCIRLHTYDYSSYRKFYYSNRDRIDFYKLFESDGYIGISSDNYEWSRTFRIGQYSKKEYNSIASAPDYYNARVNYNEPDVSLPYRPIFNI